MGWFRKHFLGDAGDAPELDHLPLNTTAKQIETPTVEKPKKVEATPDWDAKRREAAEKLGKPFKCAADGMPRETLVEGNFIDVAKARGQNVTKLADRKRR